MSKGKKPIVSNVQSIKTPVIPSNYVSKTNTWSFSFKYFREIEYYGFSHTEPKWFSSLLERLQELCTIDKDEFERQQYLRDNARYHIVKWDAKNCPIRRSNLTWLPINYLENEREFPIFQFDIGKALGRILGFWTESSKIFEVVLLDPLHNTYPDKRVNFKVRDCFPLGSEYAGLQLYLDEVKQQECDNGKCGYKRKLENVQINPYPDRLVVTYLDEDVYEEYETVLKTKSISEIIVNGILALKE